MFSIRHLVAVALIASFCSTSSASVTYSFSGFFGANLPDGWQDATATFSLTLPDVISSDFTIPVESMTACSTPYSTCLEAKFDMSAQQAGLTDKPDMQALELSSDSGTIYYYFSPDTFTTTGQHTTLDIGSPGTITICPIPCDHIPRRSWALFRARDVMRGVIESFKAEHAA